MAAGQAELPQAAGQVPLQPTPVNTQSTAQAASPTPGVPAAAAAPTQVSLTQRFPNVSIMWLPLFIYDITSSSSPIDV